MKNIANQAVVQIINKSQFSQIQIPLPPLEEQKKIVAYLDQLNATITKLKAEYQSQLTTLDEMRNSSLDLAFGGSRKEREWNLNNWKWVKLGEVCEIIGGGTPSKQNQKYYKDGKIPWATVRDMKDNIIETTEIYITQEGLENSAANIIPAYGLLIATRVGLGKVSLLTKPTAINQDLKGLLPKKRLKLHFLFWYFKSLAPYIISQGSGATVQGIKLDFLKNIQIPLPDLETQAKIVAHLDQVHQLIISLKAQISQQIQHCDELWQSSLEQALSQGVK